MALRAKLLKTVGETLQHSKRKVTIIGGAGDVGTSVAMCLLTERVTNRLSLVDINEKVLKGEGMDMQQAAFLCNHAKISYGKDYQHSQCSALGIITAGAKPMCGSDVIAQLEQNCAIIKDVVPKFLKYSPDAHLLVISNPVDINAYAAWKVSRLPAHRVIGSGTYLDSCRFRYFLSKHLGISPAAIKAVLIGEHGGSIVPCWSTVSVGGTFLKDIHPDFGTLKDVDKSMQIKAQVVSAAYDLIKLKGANWWSIGLCASHLVRQILNNTMNVCPVSVNVKGMHSIDYDVYLSLPCVLGRNGVQKIINQELSDDELAGLKRSAAIIRKSQKQMEKFLIA